MLCTARAQTMLRTHANWQRCGGRPNGLQLKPGPITADGGSMYGESSAAHPLSYADTLSRSWLISATQRFRQSDFRAQSVSQSVSRSVSQISELEHRLVKEMSGPTEASVRHVAPSGRGPEPLHVPTAVADEAFD